jgi:hypothetical protein
MWWKHIRNHRTADLRGEGGTISDVVIGGQHGMHTERLAAMPIGWNVRMMINVLMSVTKQSPIENATNIPAKQKTRSARHLQTVDHAYT